MRLPLLIRCTCIGVLRLGRGLGVLDTAAAGSGAARSCALAERLGVSPDVGFSFDVGVSVDVGVSLDVGFSFDVGTGVGFATGEASERRRDLGGGKPGGGSAGSGGVSTTGPVPKPALLDLGTEELSPESGDDVCRCPFEESSLMVDQKNRALPLCSVL
ncbi:MAG: hypothetical protein ABI333_19880 [bacterium]